MAVKKVGLSLKRHDKDTGSPEAQIENLTAQTEKAVLIDFWAEWCGPCQRLAPELEKLAAAHPEIIVGKVEVSQVYESRGLHRSFKKNWVKSINTKNYQLFLFI